MRSELEQLVLVETHCEWRGDGPFRIVAVDGASVHLQYRGNARRRFMTHHCSARRVGAQLVSVLDISEVENIHEEVTVQFS